LQAFYDDGDSLHRNSYFSIGGGAVLDEQEILRTTKTGAIVKELQLPTPLLV